MTNLVTKASIWDQCLLQLRSDVPEDDFKLWISPLQAEITDSLITLFAPNEYVIQFVKKTFLDEIQSIISRLCPGPTPKITLQKGSINSGPTAVNASASGPHITQRAVPTRKSTGLVFGGTDGQNSGNLNPRYLFDNHIIGGSNRLARAASMQVASNPGEAYNPLFLYGGVGLGKTHLTNAMGNYIKQLNPDAKVLYLHSERFVADMIKALQRNQMDSFKKFYRSINCLLIDDIQFFANKERSQEEFFHTFNYLLDGKQQIVLTCDRYPKEISGLEERLQSRFGWGLTVAIEPPELETRIAILISKAQEYKVELPNEVAFFIAKHIQSNVRELEGALKRVIANAQFTGQKISVAFAREALKDLLALQAKLVTIENIQRTVADYYKIKVADLLCKRRSRSIARPRQLAMLLSKELTTHSLPEIGDAYGGRDHTTVLHACRKMKELLSSNLSIQEDYKKSSKNIISVGVSMMKLDLQREQLLQPLEAVMGVVGQKQTMEILSHVKLCFADNQLKITGTDLEVELVSQSSITTVQQPNNITVPGKKLIEICKSLPEKSLIKLSKQKEQLILHSGKSKFILSTLAAEDFPDMDKFQGNASFEMPQKDLKTILQRTHFAMAHHDVRYYLNGILLEVTSEGLRVVATDGHRLASNACRAQTKTNHKIQIIVPRKGVLELIRLLRDDDSMVKAMIGNNFIRVSGQHYTFTSKLVEGRFPDYERVIPKNNDKTILLNKNEFKQSLARSAILCNDKFKGIKIQLSQNVMKVFARNPEHETSEEKITIDYNGEDIEMGFNVSYILENLNVLKSEQVALKFSNSNSSILLEEVGVQLDSYFVLMPMRL